MKIIFRFMLASLAIMCLVAPLAASEPVSSAPSTAAEPALEAPTPTTQLALGDLESEDASWEPDYGNCELFCDSGSVWQSFVTHAQCCNANQLCPDGSVPFITVYHSYQRAPVICLLP